MKLAHYFFNYSAHRMTERQTSSIDPWRINDNVYAAVIMAQPL